MVAYCKCGHAKGWHKNGLCELCNSKTSAAHHAFARPRTKAEKIRSLRERIRITEGEYFGKMSENDIRRLNSDKRMLRELTH